MYSHPSLTPEWERDPSYFILFLVTAVICITLAFLLTASIDENERLRADLAAERTTNRLWSDCKPPVGRQRLIVTLDWRERGAIPKYDYRCVYATRWVEAEVLSRPH